MTPRLALYKPAGPALLFMSSSDQREVRHDVGMHGIVVDRIVRRVPDHHNIAVLARLSVTFTLSPPLICIVSVFDEPPEIWLIWLPERLTDALTLLAVKSIDCMFVSEVRSSVSVMVPEFADRLTELFPAAAVDRGTKRQRRSVNDEDVVAAATEQVMRLRRRH